MRTEGKGRAAGSETAQRNEENPAQPNVEFRRAQTPVGVVAEVYRVAWNVWLGDFLAFESAIK